MIQGGVGEGEVASSREKVEVEIDEDRGSTLVVFSSETSLVCFTPETAEPPEVLSSVAFLVFKTTLTYSSEYSKVIASPVGVSEGKELSEEEAEEDPIDEIVPLEWDLIYFGF